MTAIGGTHRHNAPTTPKPFAHLSTGTIHAVTQSWQTEGLGFSSSRTASCSRARVAALHPAPTQEAAVLRPEGRPAVQAVGRREALPVDRPQAEAIQEALPAVHPALTLRVEAPGRTPWRSPSTRKPTLRVATPRRRPVRRASAARFASSTSSKAAHCSLPTPAGVHPVASPRKADHGRCASRRRPSNARISPPNVPPRPARPPSPIARARVRSAAPRRPATTCRRRS